MIVSADITATLKRHSQWVAVCDDIAFADRIALERATEKRIEQSLGFDAVVLRRYCRHVIITALALSTRVWIANGIVDIESLRRDELLARLRPYNRVLDGIGESYAAWMLRGVLR